MEERYYNQVINPARIVQHRLWDQSALHSLPLFSQCDRTRETKIVLRFYTPQPFSFLLVSSRRKAVRRICSPLPLLHPPSSYSAFPRPLLPPPHTFPYLPIPSLPHPATKTTKPSLLIERFYRPFSPELIFLLSRHLLLHIYYRRLQSVTERDDRVLSLNSYNSILMD